MQCGGWCSVRSLNWTPALQLGFAGSSRPHQREQTWALCPANACELPWRYCYPMVEVMTKLRGGVHIAWQKFKVELRDLFSQRYGAGDGEWNDEIMRISSYRTMRCGNRLLKGWKEKKVLLPLQSDTPGIKKVGPILRLYLLTENMLHPAVRLWVNNCGITAMPCASFIMLDHSQELSIHYERDFIFPGTTNWAEGMGFVQGDHLCLPFSCGKLEFTWLHIINMYTYTL